MAEPLERRQLLAVSNIAIYDVFGTEANPTDTTPLLMFRDTDTDGTFGPYTARITWGDGSTSGGAVTAVTGPGTPAGTFQASAIHVYADEGAYPVRVEVSDASGVVTSAEVTGAWSTRWRCSRG